MIDDSGTRYSLTGVEAVRSCLDEAGIDYVVDEHRPMYGAPTGDRPASVPGRQTATTVVLRDRHSWTLAVTPASKRLDLSKLRKLLGVSADLRPATEREVADHFPQFEVGAVPPVGTAVRAELVDIGMLDEGRVLFAAGDHRHSIVMDVDDLMRLTGATVADLCEE